MQFKILALAALAAAAVSAQTFEANECMNCIFASVEKDTVCAALPKEKLDSIKGALQPGKVDATPLIVGSKDEQIKACLCSWSTAAFSGAGATAGCTTGAAAVCNATQVTEGKEKLSPMTGAFKCSAAGNNTNGNSTNGNNTKPSGTSGTGPAPTGAASSMSVSYILSVAALGAAAFLGL